MDTDQKNYPSLKNDPPASLRLIWCPECGRTNQVSVLRGRHFSRGTRCAGMPVALQYSLGTDPRHAPEAR